MRVRRRAAGVCACVSILAAVCVSLGAAPPTCDIVIVGGGAAGVHTAYQFSKPGPTHQSNVCLFEKEAQLGGRILDVALNPARPKKVYGLGALRVMEGQTYLFKLAQELGITLQEAPYVDDLINSRGYFAFTSDDMRALAYPFVGNTETELYDTLRFGPLRANVTDYPDFRSYIRTAIGSQGYQFLTDVFRFRADFEYPLDARGYLDYLDEEWDVCCIPSYPVGGMSRFIKRMAAMAQANGVQIFLEEPVTHIDKDGSAYDVRTPKRLVKTPKLIVAVDAVGFGNVGGTTATAIINQPEFQDLIGVKVVSIDQRWPSAWWLNSGYSGKDIHRAWTTEQCLNFIEIPTAPYAANQLVTRTVYDDDIRCVEFWEHAVGQGIPKVEEEIMRGLQHLFPNATIPAALNTVVKIWPAAWYWLRAGTSFTNADIAAWAVDPLPGEQVALVGESYNPQRSGWSDAAYKSSINLLNQKYGFNISITGPNPGRRTATRGRPGR